MDQTLRLRLERTDSPSEVAHLLDRAERDVVEAKRRRDSDLALDAAEAKVLAARRLGELAANVGRSGGGRPRGNTSHAETGLAEFRSEAGASRATVARWQQIAAVPHDDLEAVFAACREEGEPVTLKRLLTGVARRPTPPTRRGLDRIAAALAAHDRAQEASDAIRARAGLPPVPESISARRWRQKLAEAASRGEVARDPLDPIIERLRRECPEVGERRVLIQQAIGKLNRARREVPDIEHLLGS